MNMDSQNDTVASLMIPLARYPHLRADAPMREALHLLYTGLAQPELSAFRRALVLGNDNILVGIVNMPSLLLGLEPDVLRTQPGGPYQGYAAQSDTDGSMAVQVFWERIFSQGFDQELERPVGEVALPVPDTVTPDDKLARALNLMLTKKQLMLPVVKDGQVIGVVRMIEIFQRVVATMNQQVKP